jgi:hypothetical protein
MPSRFAEVTTLEAVRKSGSFAYASGLNFESLSALASNYTDGGSPFSSLNATLRRAVAAAAGVCAFKPPSGAATSLLVMSAVLLTARVAMLTLVTRRDVRARGHAHRD